MDPSAEPVAPMAQRLSTWLVAALLLALVLWRLISGLTAPERPGPADPVHQLSPAAASQEVRLRGVVAAPLRPRGDGSGCAALVQVAGGRTEALFEPCAALQPNWQVELEGRLVRPQPAPHPLLAGPAERLARRGVFTQLRVARWRVLQQHPAPVAALRSRLVAALQRHAGPERGALMAALVVGQASAPLPPELAAAFRAAGLSHTLAASGFHLSVLLGALLPLARRFALAPPLQLAVGGAAIGLFVLLAGPQAGVLRAALMALLALLLLACGRQGRSLPLLLLVSAGMLLWHPAWLRDVGFQLSVVATGALIVSAGPLEQQLRRWRLPGWLAVALAVPLAASLWTLPLQMAHFGVVPLFAVPANLLAAPLLTPLTLGSMAAALLALLLPGLLPLLVAPVAWLAGVLLLVAQTVAAWPMAQWQLGRPLPWLVLLLALALAGWLLPGLPRRWRRCAPLLLALVVALHLGLLWRDQLLLVHQQSGDRSRDLLVARHRGRAALVATQADGYSCRQAAQLAAGLGVPGFDWVLLLDPVPSPVPACWAPLAHVVLASGDGSPPLLPGQRLASAGLAVMALGVETRGVQLQVGPHHWLLLPDPQALWSWRQAEPRRALQGVWLGFQPRPRDRLWLQQQSLGRVWLSGRAVEGWAGTGPSGWLQASL